MERDDIRMEPISPDHRPMWRPLFEGYGRFYDTEITNAKADRVWEWLMDDDHPLEGRIAFIGRDAMGFIHFRPLPSTLRGCEIGHLEDIFVLPAIRSRGVGHALINEFLGIARDRGWPCANWVAAEDNRAARALYDKVGKKGPWVIYETTL